MAGDGFLDKYELFRESNTSNVFVFITNDRKRIEQAIQYFLGKKDYKTLVYDIQLNKIYELSANNEEIRKTEREVDMITNVYQEFYSLLQNEKVNLIIKFVYSEDRMLNDFLIAVSQEDRIYAQQSSAVVFADSDEVFPRILKKFAVFLEVELPTEEEREVLLHQVKKSVEEIRGCRINVDKRVYRESRGLNLHEIETAALISIKQSGYKKISTEAFRDFKVEILKSYGLQYINPVRGFESVGGYETVKKYIQARIINVLKNPEKAKEYGIEIPRGVLFYGPPGTGKTYLTKALAKELGLPMIQINMSDFLRGIVGESERRVREVTRIIESLAPCVVFIDEFDQIALQRGSYFSGDSGVTRRVQNQLLEWLGDENRKSLIIGATNFIQQLDDAFVRVGRIDDIVPILYPDEAARYEILKVHLKVVRNVPTKMSAMDLKEIAKKTEFFTGAELEKVVKEAAYLAFEKNKKVTAEEFEEVLQDFQINRQEREKKLKQMLAQLEKLEAINKRFLKEYLRKELKFARYSI